MAIVLAQDAKSQLLNIYAENRVLSEISPCFCIARQVTLFFLSHRAISFPAELFSFASLPSLLLCLTFRSTHDCVCIEAAHRIQMIALCMHSPIYFPKCLTDLCLPHTCVFCSRSRANILPCRIVHPFATFESIVLRCIQLIFFLSACSILFHRQLFAFALFVDVLTYIFESIQIFKKNP